MNARSRTVKNPRGVHLHNHISERLLNASVSEAREELAGLGNVDVHREGELLSRLSFRDVGNRRRDLVGDIHCV